MVKMTITVQDNDGLRAVTKEVELNDQFKSPADICEQVQYEALKTFKAWQSLR